MVRRMLSALWYQLHPSLSLRSFQLKYQIRLMTTTWKTFLSVQAHLPSDIPSASPTRLTPIMPWMIRFTLHAFPISPEKWLSNLKWIFYIFLCSIYPWRTNASLSTGSTNDNRRRECGPRQPLRWAFLLQLEVLSLATEIKQIKLWDNNIN